MAQPGNRGGETSRGAAALLAPLLVGAVCLVFVWNNLALYLGLNSAGALTMFSGLPPTYDTHFFLPHHSASDDFEYVRVVQMAARPADLKTVRELGAFLKALPPNTPVNRNFLRYQANRVCGSAANAALRFTLVRPSGELLEIKDACGQPEWRGYAVLSGYEVCLQGCNDLLKQWARGQLTGG